MNQPRHFATGKGFQPSLALNDSSRKVIHALLMMGFLSALFGCKKESSTEQSQPSVGVVTNDDQHNEIYERGSQLISPHMQLLDRDPRVTKAVREQVTRGIRDLDAVTAFNPANWAAFWIKGKGYQVLGAHEAANKEFKASFDIQKENPDVAREYAASCLELRRGAEAVRVAQHAIEVTPDDAGLYANLALAFLIDGKNTEAKRAVEQALTMEPQDKISQAVRGVVDDIIAGKRTQPKTMADLNKKS
jgi:tetratricopeptide (TPR) repeat protein